MAQLRKPSRILNERSIFMGLDFSDLIGLAVSLLIFQMCFKPLHKEFLALISTIVTGVCLSALRLKYRRRIIRDYLHSKIGSKRL